jgi:thiaminase
MRTHLLWYNHLLAAATALSPSLLTAGSPHPLYQQWIDKYGGQEFEGIVMQMVHLVNEVAADLGQAQVSALINSTGTQLS